MLLKYHTKAPTATRTAIAAPAIPVYMTVLSLLELCAALAPPLSVEFDVMIGARVVVVEGDLVVGISGDLVVGISGDFVVRISGALVVGISGAFVVGISGDFVVRI